jgi:SAM-dependent methyltransferase
MVTRSGPEDGDPLMGSSWSRPDTVAGFARSAPNPALMQCAASEMDAGSKRLLDIGCGAGRNIVPLARLGWNAVGIDLSLAMIAAAVTRMRDEHLETHLQFALAGMHELPFPARSFDFIIAHGIWNLARSGREFRLGLAEAARVARPRSALFVFTFSRNTLPPDARPVPTESFVFTQFSGERQCFLTSEELASELGAVGFSPDPLSPLRELNLPKPGTLYSGGAPVIYEGVFRRTAG